MYIFYQKYKFEYFFCKIGKIIYAIFPIIFIVKKNQLTKNEKKVLYGLVKFPEKNDKELSKLLDVKLSTFTSIKKRLISQKLLRTINIPLLHHLGCELLAVIYTQFNPVIPLEERVKTTKSTIEVFEEIFYSIGEQEKGFSISLSKNYTNIGRINDIRTETFGKVGLLEDEYPNEIVFPFEISKIIRFFDFSRIIKEFFNLDEIKDGNEKYLWFDSKKEISLNSKEIKVYLEIINNPNLTTQKIGENVGLSRHTVSRMKKGFFENGLIKSITIPNLKKLGFEILAFYPINFNPNKHPRDKDIDFLDTNPTVFYAKREFKGIIISAYPTYQSYKEDKMHKIRYLKENDLIVDTPAVGKYMYERMVVIKDFNFSAISKKLLE